MLEHQKPPSAYKLSTICNLNALNFSQVCVLFLYFFFQWFTARSTFKPPHPPKTLKLLKRSRISAQRISDGGARNDGPITCFQKLRLMWSLIACPMRPRRDLSTASLFSHVRPMPILIKTGTAMKSGSSLAEFGNSRQYMMVH